MTSKTSKLYTCGFCNKKYTWLGRNRHLKQKHRIAIAINKIKLRIRNEYIELVYGDIR